MSKRPILSICIPTYNRAFFLEATLTQLKQELTGIEEKIELCISNNGSTDNTEKVIKKFALENPKLKLVTSKFDINKGIDINFKKVLDLANGKYSFTMGDDDTLVPSRLKALVAYLEKESNLDYLVCNAIRADKSHILGFLDVSDLTIPSFICYEGVEKNKEIIIQTLLASTAIFVNVYNTDLVRKFSLPVDTYVYFSMTCFALRSILNSGRFSVMKNPLIQYEGFGDLFTLDMYITRFDKGLQLNEDLNRDFCTPYHSKCCDLKLDPLNFFVLSAIFTDEKDEAKKRKLLEVFQKLKNLQIKQDPLSFLSFFSYALLYLFNFYSIRKFMSILYYSYCKLFKKKTFKQKNKERLYARASEF